MNITQEEYNQETIKLLKKLIAGIEEGKINASEINNASEFDEVMLDEEVVARNVLTGYHRLYIRYKEVEHELG